jgi:hypothetical protein
MRRSVGGTFSSCLGDQPGDVSVSLACRAALRIGAKGCVLCGALMTVPATESLRVDKRGAVHQRRSGIRWTALALFHPAGRMIQTGCGPESGHARRAMDHRSSWRRRAGSDILLTRHASRIAAAVGGGLRSGAWADKSFAGTARRFSMRQRCTCYSALPPTTGAAAML